MRHSFGLLLFRAHFITRCGQNHWRRLHVAQKFSTLSNKICPPGRAIFGFSPFVVHLFQLKPPRFSIPTHTSPYLSDFRQRGRATSDIKFNSWYFIRNILRIHGGAAFLRIICLHNHIVPEYQYWTRHVDASVRVESVCARREKRFPIFDGFPGVPAIDIYLLGANAKRWTRLIIYWHVLYVEATKADKNRGPQYQLNLSGVDGDTLDVVVLCVIRPKWASILGEKCAVEPTQTRLWLAFTPRKSNRSKYKCGDGWKWQTKMILRKKNIFCSQLRDWQMTCWGGSCGSCLTSEFLCYMFRQFDSVVVEDRNRYVR